MTYKVIIVDDEPLAREIIQSHLANLDAFELVASCQNAIEANTVLQTEDVDLMFLDIQMPNLSGVDFLKSLNNPPDVIFTTAYSEYAVDGFNLNAIDYLLKPIGLDRFLQATNKFIEKQSTTVSKGVDDFFFVKADKKMVKIHFDDILYVEGLKDYVIIKQNDSRVIALQTMKSLESKLPSDTFMRIHRSYIINLDKIEAVFGSMVEIMEGGNKKNIPIGKNYKDALLELINSNRL